MLGVAVIITLDQHFINNFNVQFIDIQKRLRAMTTQFDLPYSGVILPRLFTPHDILEYANYG